MKHYSRSQRGVLVVQIVLCHQAAHFIQAVRRIGLDSNRFIVVDFALESRTNKGSCGILRVEFVAHEWGTGFWGR